MMITFPKLLILAVVAWVVWTFLKRNNIIGGSKSGAPRAEGPTPKRQAEGAIEDMVKCPKCGSYVPAKGGHDCPGA